MPAACPDSEGCAGTQGQEFCHCPGNAMGFGMALLFVGRMKIPMVLGEKSQ